MITTTNGGGTSYFHFKEKLDPQITPGGRVGLARQLANVVLENPLLIAAAGEPFGLGISLVNGAWNWYNGSGIFTSDVVTYALIGGVSSLANRVIGNSQIKKHQKSEIDYIAFCYRGKELQLLSEKKRFLAELAESVEKISRRKLEYGFLNFDEAQIVFLLERAISEPVYWRYCKRLLQSIIQPTEKDLKSLLVKCIYSGFAEGVSLLASKGFTGWNTSIDRSNRFGFPFYLAYQASKLEVGVELVKQGAKPMIEELTFSSEDQQKDYEAFVDLVERTIIHRERNKSNAYLILWAHQKCTLNVLPLDVIKTHILPEVLKV